MSPGGRPGNCTLGKTAERSRKAAQRRGWVARSRPHTQTSKTRRGGTSEQVRARVGPGVGPDQLPVKVVVLALPVVAEAGVRVLVEGAAGCREERRMLAASS